MWYALVFTILGIALVAVVLTRSARPKPKIDPAPHHHSGGHPGTEHAS